ncbi:hypothetical protein BZA77DRAFT_46183 [Pyronema omphalodes]|nr:hypothetical protein BZA77DRAFT_46183 [Pyronema omphalodes]
MSKPVMSVDPMNLDEVTEDQSVLEDGDVAIIEPGPEVPEAGPTKPSADDYEAMKSLLFVEDPNLEVENECIYHWDIENWKKMDRKSHSPVFMCGDSPWKILFFPYGNNCECASLYLEQGYPDKPPEDWYKCVQFGLVLWNPNDPTNFVHHQAHHRFTADEGDWGFTRFAELRELFLSNDKRPRPLIENDCSRITAYVRTIKDPTGVLWHNFIGYDSKKTTGYVGLKNQGATCYLNSLLQSLYFTNSFRKAVFKIPTQNENLSNSALTLQRLFYQLQTHSDAVSTLELTKSFGWDTQDIFAQQDIQELNRVLMENLENKMKGTDVEKFLNDMFVGKAKTYIRCTNVDYTSERIEDYWDIQLNVRGMKNLDDSFKDYIRVEMMDGENKYSAEGHGLQDAEKGIIFESFPDVLHLHLKRFEYDFATYSLQKVNDHFEFPEVFDASHYLSDDAEGRDDNWEYVLTGVLVHSGDINAGHYYAFIRPEKDGEFLKFDDDRVTKATKHDAIEDNFGGDYDYGKLQNGQRNTFKRSMNAYMLIYVRKNKIDEILVPITKADIPPHVPQKLEDERLIREQERKEREERHLYLNVKMITSNHFRNYQGFDLTNWDDKDTMAAEEAKPITIRFKKSAKIGELVQAIAEMPEVNVDPRLIRLWIMVNRQNKTIRPDQPLLDFDRTVEDMAVKHSSKAIDFRVWVEIQNIDPAKLDDPPVDNANDPRMCIFLKHFDPIAQTLLGVTHVYVRKKDRVHDLLLPQISKIMNWPESLKQAEIQLFEEIKPSMIDQIKPKQTFEAAEIQDGDIICFQKAPTIQEAQALRERGLPTTAMEFYSYMTDLIKVKLLPKVSGTGPELTLIMNKKMSYDDVSERVAKQLNVPPTHIQFRQAHTQSSAPKAPLKRAQHGTLGAMVSVHNYYGSLTSLPNMLYYEILDISLAELETKKLFKFIWLPDGISKEEPCETLVPKTGAMSDLIPYLVSRYNLNAEQEQRIRFFSAHGGKFQKQLTRDYPVLQQDYNYVYAELTPEDELKFDPETSKLLEAFHFHKEPSKTHSTAVPFKFVVKKDEVFTDTKLRLQTRIGIKGKPFEKIQFAIVRRKNYSQPEYLNDEDILYDMVDPADDDLLGLDHFDKNNRSNGYGRSTGEIRIK